jgi:hypothetical protein
MNFAEYVHLNNELERLKSNYRVAVDLLVEAGYLVSAAEYAKLKAFVEAARYDLEAVRSKLEQSEAGRPRRFGLMRSSGSIIRCRTRTTSAEAEKSEVMPVFDRYNIVSESDLKDAARCLGQNPDHKKPAVTKAHTTGTQTAETLN